MSNDDRGKVVVVVYGRGAYEDTRRLFLALHFIE
jgi:hypothetical protein